MPGITLNLRAYLCSSLLSWTERLLTWAKVLGTHLCSRLQQRSRKSARRRWERRGLSSDHSFCCACILHCLTGCFSSAAALIAHNLDFQIDFWAIISVCNLAQRHEAEGRGLTRWCLKGNLLNTLLTCSSPRRCSSCWWATNMSVSALALQLRQGRRQEPTVLCRPGHKLW